MQQQWPADAVERRPLASLVPAARNARTHSDEQVAQIAASIGEWGWTVPVLVDEAGTIIAGHGRVLAAAKIGLSDVPVMVARGWTDAQKRAYVIADNKLAENAGWDEAVAARGRRSRDAGLRPAADGL
jgi:ParB-like chromosome segregation protein Spo0J